MEPCPLPALPSPVEEESSGTGRVDVTGQRGDTALEKGKPADQKKKKNKHKKQRSCRKESGKFLLSQLPFADVDIGALFEITRSVDKKVKKKRKRHKLESEDGDKSKKQKRANYFVSLPITNSKIHDDIQTIQDSVKKKDDRLCKAMVPRGSYHITLFVMHLAAAEDVHLAVNALLESKKTVEEILQGRVLVLSFSGLAYFKHEVVYAHAAEGDSITTLKQITETMGKIFEEKGISVIGSKDFVPHLTLMKLSRSPKLRKQGIKKIDTNLYKDFQSHYFGEELFQQLDLCSMLKKRQLGGYYHTEASIFFDTEPISTPTSVLVEHMQHSQNEGDTGGLSEGIEQPAQPQRTPAHANVQARAKVGQSRQGAILAIHQKRTMRLHQLQHAHRRMLRQQLNALHEDLIAQNSYLLEARDGQASQMECVNEQLRHININLDQIREGQAAQNAVLGRIANALERLHE